MYAKLKEFFSSDIDLNNYWPDDEENFGFWVSLLIGPENTEGSEIFQLLICTPDWLKSENVNFEPVWGRHMLIVFEYNLTNIKAAVERYIENCSGENWEDIAIKLTRIAAWEFEDYQPDKSMGSV